MDKRCEATSMKRRGDASNSSRRLRSRSYGEAAAPAVEREAPDDKVEEFFAILRRMRDATGCCYAGSPRSLGDGGSGKMAAELWWRPAFSLEDFGDREEACSRRVASEEKDKSPAEDGIPPCKIDLNAVPETAGKTGSCGEGK
ncbi:hypothetical protein AXF42_Ash014154 [Apostasia shenzhenica]|uniref:Uncharacterized protein n=1 Tax=Apostasia shenzhenica TaxID=1088818 RepID=A0A2I0A132_9ASPA|nr:hypothetical protein AXF42_Ash014154 [Apostasia shenzhenica]